MLQKKTLEDIYLNKANQIVFQESHQSDYWIVELKKWGILFATRLKPENKHQFKSN